MSSFISYTGKISQVPGGSKFFGFHLLITTLGKFVIFYDITGSERNWNLPIISMYQYFCYTRQDIIISLIDFEHFSVPKAYFYLVRPRLEY